MCCEVSLQIMELFNDGAIKVLEYAKTGVNSKHNPRPSTHLWVLGPVGYCKGQTKEILGVPAYLESYTLPFLELLKSMEVR